MHSAPDDFKVIDMGEDEYNPPITIRRPFLSTVKAIIYIGTGEVHMHFPSEKARCYIVEDSEQVRTRRRRCNRNQRRQNHQGRMGGLRVYEGEVHREDSYT